MRLEDMAEKLGFKMGKKKTLAGGEDGKPMYARTDIILTDATDSTKPPMIFRDRGAVELFLESRAQLELIKEQHQGKPKTRA